MSTSSISSIVPWIATRRTTGSPIALGRFGARRVANTPVRSRIEKRRPHKRIVRAPVKDMDTDNPGKTVQVLETFCIFRQQFDGSPYSPGTGRLDGHAGKVGEGEMDNTYRGTGKNRFFSR